MNINKLKKIGIGTANFGINYGPNHKKLLKNEINKILNFAQKNNLYTLDTALSYGRSEEIIGNFIKRKNKNKWNIITKFVYNSKDLYNLFSKSKQKLNIKPQIVLAHRAKDYLNSKFRKQLINLKKKYKIEIGVSIYTIAEIKKILKVYKPDVVQLPMNIIDRKFVDYKILTLLKRKKIKIHARSIFFRGMFNDSNNALNKKYKKEIYKLKLIAKEKKLTLNHLSLLWIYNKKEIDKIIIGIESLTELKENLNILNKKISKNVANQIEKVKIKKSKFLDLRKIN